MAHGHTALAAIGLPTFTNGCFLATALEGIAMFSHDSDKLTPRNGHTLVVGIVARISGCGKHKEVSNEDQVDHAKEEVKQRFNGPVEYRVFATKANRSGIAKT